MSSDELTQDFPSSEPTKPTIETLLERMNEMIIAQNKLAASVAQLEISMENGFRRVERKIELLNNDFLEIRADQADLLRRVEALERLAS